MGRRLLKDQVVLYAILIPYEKWTRGTAPGVLVHNLLLGRRDCERERDRDND